MSSDYVGAFIGARGQGKSKSLRLFLKRQKARRVMVFDPKRDPWYEKGWGPVVSSMAEVVAIAAKAGKRGAFKVVYRPPTLGEKIFDLFSIFCDVAMQAGDVWLACDELAMVTRPGWAPEGWKRAVLIGRDPAKVRIVAASQRPTGCDKEFWSNCTHISTFRLNFEEDAKTLSRLIGVTPAEIMGLAPGHSLQRDTGTGETKKIILK